MLADYFTKPLQGATFHKFRDTIMNCQFVRSDVSPSDHRSVLERMLSRVTALRLTQNQSEGAKEMTPQQRKRQEESKNYLVTLILNLGTIVFVLPWCE